MQRPLLPLLCAALLCAACGSQPLDEWSDAAGRETVDIVRQTLLETNADECGLLAISVATGRVVASQVIVRDSLGQPVAGSADHSLALYHEPVRLGGLFAPVLTTAALSSLRVDTADRFSVVDAFVRDERRIYVNGMPLDSLTMRQAMAAGSHAALSSFGNHCWQGDCAALVADALVCNTTTDTAYHLRLPDSLATDTAFFQLCIGHHARQPLAGIAAFYNTLARGGVPVSNFPVAENEPALPGKPLCSRDVAARMTALLQGAGEIGPAAQALSRLPFRVAAKSARIPMPDGSGRCECTALVGYFPADNPRYTLLLYVKNSDPATSAVADAFSRIAEVAMK